MKRMLLLILLFFNANLYCAPLVVGVLQFAPPFSSHSGDKNNYYGFAIDLMNDICKRLQLECVYKPVLLEQQQNELDEGNVDLVFTFTPIPAKPNPEYIFSLPYIPSEGQFVTLAGNGIKDVADLKNKKVGVVNISLFLPVLEANKSFYSEIKIYSNVSDLVAALGDKKVDAMIMDFTLASYVVNNNLIQGAIFIGKKIPAGSGYGMFTLKKNAKLIQDINASLIKIEADGTYTALYNKYFSK